MSTDLVKRKNRFQLIKLSTDLYEINTAINRQFVYKFKKNINGISRDFEVVNADFEDNSRTFTKNILIPLITLVLSSRNDGLGLTAPITDFPNVPNKVHPTCRTYNFEDPVENRRQLIGAENINETDVYFQQVSDPNVVLTKWQKFKYSWTNFTI